MLPRTPPTVGAHHFAPKLSSHREIGGSFLPVQWYSKASEHLLKKCAVDRVVHLLQVDETEK